MTSEHSQKFWDTVLIGVATIIIASLLTWVAFTMLTLVKQNGIISYQIGELLEQSKDKSAEINVITKQQAALTFQVNKNTQDIRQLRQQGHHND